METQFILEEARSSLPVMYYSIFVRSVCDGVGLLHTDEEMEKSIEGTDFEAPCRVARV